MSLQLVEKRLFQLFKYNLFQSNQINNEELGISKKELTTDLNRLVKKNKLVKFGISGLFQFVKWQEIVGMKVPINKANLNEVINFLYMKNDNGFLFGFTTMESLGLTNQISRTLIVMTNQINYETTKLINGTEVKVIPAVIPVTSSNKIFLEGLMTYLLPGLVNMSLKAKNETVKRLVSYSLSDGINLNDAVDIICSLPKEQMTKIIKDGFYNELLVSTKVFQPAV